MVGSYASLTMCSAVPLPILPQKSLTARLRMPLHLEVVSARIRRCVTVARVKKGVRVLQMSASPCVRPMFPFLRGDSVVR